MAHLHETWKHAEKAVRDAIAAYADSLPNSVWILSRHVLTTKEVEHVFYEFLGYPKGPINPFREKLKHVLYENMKEPVEIVDGDYGFCKTLAEVESDSGLQANFAEWKMVDDSFPGAKAVSSGAVQIQGTQIVVAKIRAKYKEYILEKLPDRIPDGNIVAGQRKLDFIAKAPWEDFDAWPTTYLLLHVDEQIVRHKDAPVDPSQFVDLVHLGALPYVDLFLCDQRTKDYIRRAKVPNHVSSRCFHDLGEALAEI